MLYLTVKHVHVVCAVLSICGFCLRGLLLMRNSALMGRRWMRILPHVNDSILLAAAIGLAVMLGQYPFVHGWLTAKICGLIAYIILGAQALRPGHDPRLRLAAGLAAVGVFGWIVSVALSKHPAGFLV